MENTAAQPNMAPIIVDLGEQNRSKVNDLHKGEGDLIDTVHNCIEELKKNETIGENSQPVIVVVEKKSKSSQWSLLDDDDDD